MTSEMAVIPTTKQNTNIVTMHCIMLLPFCTEHTGDKMYNDLHFVKGI